MKLHLFLPVMALLIGSMGCHSPEKAATAAVPPQLPNAGTTVSNIPVGSPSKHTATPPRMVHVSFDRLPPASASRRAYLATGWWHFDMAFQASDSLAHLQYQPKWLKFRENQTFDILINNQVVDTGEWNWDESTNIIYVSCRDPYVNNTWKVNDKGFLMIWIGNTDLNVTGIQIRVIGTKTPPPGN